jgi:SWI/SNF-related matrix-associated actin-dependent regulator of chromatin subfamily A3
MATRVHLIEPGWNPAIEQQAMDRVHRLGQTRRIKKIRYIVKGEDSVEEVTRTDSLYPPNPPS